MKDIGKPLIPQKLPRGLQIADLDALSRSVTALQILAGGWDKLAELIGVSRQRLYDWVRAPRQAKRALHNNRTEPRKARGKKAVTAGKKLVAMPSLPTYDHAIRFGIVAHTLQGPMDSRSEIAQCKEWLLRVGLEGELLRRAGIDAENIPADTEARGVHFENLWSKAGDRILPVLEFDIKAHSERSTSTVARQLLVLHSMIQKANDLPDHMKRLAAACYLTQTAFRAELQAALEEDRSLTVGFVWKCRAAAAIERLQNAQFRGFVRELLTRWTDKDDKGTNVCGFILGGNSNTEGLRSALEKVLGPDSSLHQNRFRLFVSLATEEDDDPLYPDIWFIRPPAGEIGDDFVGWIAGREDKELEKRIEMSSVQEMKSQPWAWSVGLIRLAKPDVVAQLRARGLNEPWTATAYPIPNDTTNWKQI